MKKFQNLITIATVLALILILTLTSCSKDSKDETKPVEPEFELKGIVTTLAGSSAGDVDGVGELAKFFGPLGMCTDENGNIYVVDTNNNKIKKISPSGVVTTFAGSTQGDLDSVNPLNAKFYSPRDICRDSQGNFYITDSGNNKIKKISKIGGVSTINTSSINFNKIFSICLDNSDNLYVSDIYNTTYRFTKIIKITPNGIISYFVGSTNSQDLRLAADMCFDKDNNLYVADVKSDKIKKIDTNGNITQLAGSDEGDFDGDGSNAKIYAPRAICYDKNNNNLYITSNSKIKKVSLTGKVTSVAGGNSYGSTDGTGQMASFNFNDLIATGLTFFNNKLYVSDTGNNRIRVIE